jgi:hypothetical protein
MSESKHCIFGPSSLERRMACPGSMHLEEQHWGEDNGSPDAAEGTMLHELMATCNSLEEAVDRKPELTIEQQRTLKRCFDLMGTFGFDTGNILMKEYRLEYVKPCPRCGTFFDFTAKPLAESEIRKTVCAECGTEFETSIVFHGTADLIAVNRAKECGVIIDWKFGRNPVEFAIGNIQLAAYALALHSEIPELKSIKVRPCQPRCHRMDDSYAFTDFDALADSIVEIIDNCKPDDAPRYTGDHCKYCRGKTECPEHSGQIFEVVKVDVQSLPPVTSMPDEDLKRYFDGSKLFAEWVKEVKEEIRRRAELAGGSACGYTLGKGRNTYSCKDVNELFGYADSTGITAEEFRAICSVPKKELLELRVNKMVATAKLTGHKLTKTAAAEQVEEELKAYFDVNIGEPILRKDK